MAISVTLSNQYLDRTAAQTITWSNSDTNLDGHQTSYELQYKLPSDTSWRTIGEKESTTASANLVDIFDEIGIDAQEIYFRIKVNYTQFSTSAVSGKVSGHEYSPGYSVMFHGKAIKNLVVANSTTSTTSYPIYEDVQGRGALTVATTGYKAGKVPLVDSGHFLAGRLTVATSSSASQKAAIGLYRYSASTGAYANGYWRAYTYRYYGNYNAYYGQLYYSPTTRYTNHFYNEKYYTRTYGKQPVYGTRYYKYVSYYRHEYGSNTTANASRSRYASDGRLYGYVSVNDYAGATSPGWGFCITYANYYRYYTSSIASGLAGGGSGTARYYGTRYYYGGTRYHYQYYWTAYNRNYYVVRYGTLGLRYYYTFRNVAYRMGLVVMYHYYGSSRYYKGTYTYIYNTYYYPRIAYYAGRFQSASYIWEVAASGRYTTTRYYSRTDTFYTAGSSRYYSYSYNYAYNYYNGYYSRYHYFSTYYIPAYTNTLTRYYYFTNNSYSYTYYTRGGL